MAGNRQQATGNSSPRTIITLLTDFGTEDTYVGQMKGVIAGLCPDAVVIDLTHAVRPQHIEQGAFLLETALGAFPEGAIHVAVVDPGVGTQRAALALRARGRTFVGPDNGLLSCALPDELRAGDRTAMVRLPPTIEAVSLTPPAGRPVSPTFHGRDLFAVAAGRLAAGVPLAALGTSVESVTALPAFSGRPLEPGIVGGYVVHIDRFGNVVTTIRAGDLPGGVRVLTVGDRRIEVFVTTYAEGQGLVALIGSGGYLEAAEVNGNAAARLGAHIGMPVSVHAE
jgi:S-adenosylmethionine hydrolase